MKTTPAQLKKAVDTRAAEAAQETADLNDRIAREAAITARGYELFAESRQTASPISLNEGKRLAALELETKPAAATVAPVTPAAN